MAQDALSFHWDFGDGFMSNLENPIHTFNDYSDFFVCLTVEHTCDETIFCDSIQIISPEGIGKSKIHSIGIFPNPFQNEVRISNISSTDYFTVELNLYDQRGINVFSQLFNLYSSTEYEVKLNEINSGVYSLVLQSDEFYVIKKLIKL